MRARRANSLGSSFTAARSAVACRRARVRQGQAFGGAEEAPSLTATARDGFLACCWSGREKACGAVEQEKWPKERKWSVLCNSRLTNRGPYKACSGFTHVTARRIAQPPKATFVARLRPGRLPDQAARQLPDLSTIIRVRSSLTDNSRLRGALPATDPCAAAKQRHYSIASSAIACSVRGTVRPSACVLEIDRGVELDRGLYR